MYYFICDNQLDWLLCANEMTSAQIKMIHAILTICLMKVMNFQDQLGLASRIWNATVANDMFW